MSVQSLGERRFLTPLVFATFAVIYSSTVVGALVTPIASEFGITAGAVGLAAAAYALPGVVIGTIAGPLSDRLGRGWFLAGGTLILGALTIAAAAAPTFTWLIALRALAGLGASLVLPNMMAAVADRFAYRERGRVIARIFFANTAGNLAGLSVAGVIAGAYGWRVSLAIAGILGVVAFALLAGLHGRAHTAPREVSFRALYASVLGDRSAMSLLGSNLLGVVTWVAWTTYIVAFFQRAYGLPQGVASTYALVQGCGMLVGSQIGGRLGDRIGQRLVLCSSLIGFGVLVLAVVLAVPALPVAIAGLLIAALFYGMRATSNAALMGQQVASARATVFALSAATVSAGTVIAGTGGGAAVDAGGFGALGVFCLVSAALSALVAAALVRERDDDGVVAAGPAL